MSSFSETPEENLATIEHDAYIIQLTKLLAATSMTVYIYDFFLTYDDEVFYMWKARFGLGKVVYFAIRYLTLIAILFINIIMFLPRASDELYVPRPYRLERTQEIKSLNVTRCVQGFLSVYVVTLNIDDKGLTWIRFNWIAGLAIGLLTEIPLLLRIYALYNKNRKILIFLIICFTGTAVSMIALCGTLMQTEGGTMAYFGSADAMHMCVPVNLSRRYKFFWIPLLANEFILLCLALVKWVHNYKLYGLQHSSFNELVKGSIMYFVSTFTFFLLSHLIWVIRDESYMELPVGFAISMGGIMSQKLLLDVRKYHNRGDADQFAYNISIVGGSIEMGNIRCDKLDDPAE